MQLDDNIAMITAGLTGLGIGVLVVWLWARGSYGAQLLNMLNQMESQQLHSSQQIEQLQLRCRQTESDLLLEKSRLQDKEVALERAVLAEARLSSQVEHLQHNIQGFEIRAAEAVREASQLRSDNTLHREKITYLETTLEAQKKQADEKLALLEQARASLNVEFKLLANAIFDDKQKLFREQNQTQLDTILKPLGERIRDFEKRVEETYNKESKERFSLANEVRNLQALNARISQDAVNLTNALKGENKTQGTWGEVILERVLEKSGLVKGREYEVQVSMKNEHGQRLQPDVVIHLPEGKDVIVDSKVSLVAYERFCSAETDEERATALKAHQLSIRQHIKQLSAKDYQDLNAVRTLDFVLLFIPIEAAFTLAVQQDNEIFASAFDENIVLVAPSTLLATLRIIQNIWRYEQQNKNAQEIASKAGALYDKFVNFVDDLDEIGTRLVGLQKTYDGAYNKLVSGRGNLVTRAENMKQLGAKTRKSLPAELIETDALEVLETPEKRNEIDL